MKNRLTFIIGLFIGLIICSITVYAGSFFAEDFSYTNPRNPNVKTIMDAINDLNSNGTIGEVNINIVRTYQLYKLCSNCTWEVENTSIATINSNGLITGVEAGQTNIYVKNGENVELVYKVNVLVSNNAVQFTSGVVYSGSYYSGGSTALNYANTYLFDGIKTKQGEYGAILINTGNKLYFNVKNNLYITFSSNSYSDSGGRSGKTASFYKKNSSGTYELYYNLTQQNNTSDYGKHFFEKGEYYVATSSKYVEFDEWDLSAD